MRYAYVGEATDVIRSERESVASDLVARRARRATGRRSGRFSSGGTVQNVRLRNRWMPLLIGAGVAMAASTVTTYAANGRDAWAVLALVLLGAAVVLVVLAIRAWLRDQRQR